MNPLWFAAYHILLGIGVGGFYHKLLYKSMHTQQQAQATGTPVSPAKFALGSLVRFAFAGIAIGVLSYGHIHRVGWLLLGFATTHAAWLAYWGRKKPPTNPAPTPTQHTAKSSNKDNVKSGS